ncbi:hypothetical protein CR513_51841, partial [Mucuna pruriens]
MGSPSINWEGLSPKFKYIINTMNELRKKLDLARKGIDVMPKDAQSTNDKVVALSRAKEDGYGEGNYSDHSKSSRSSKEERHERHERRERHDRSEEDRRGDLDMSKCKLPPFLWNYKLEFYIDWELKVEQVVTSFDIKGRKGDYALIWWTTMLDDIRRGVVEPCESWYELKRTYIIGSRYCTKDPKVWRSTTKE